MPKMNKPEVVETPVPAISLSEEAILKLMRQDIKRKQYQVSPKSIANRKAYQAKHQAEQKAASEFMKDLKENHPDQYAAYMAKVSG